MKINEDILRRIKTSNKVKARLCYEFDVSAQTVYRWLSNEPDGYLTRYRAVKIIAEELNIPPEKILTETEL